MIFQHFKCFIEVLPEVDIYEPVVERETGEAVTMLCKVTANPIIELADIIWTKGSDFDNILRTDYRYDIKYSQTCVKRASYSKIDKTNNLMTYGSLLKVESIAECSPWSILQYF